MLIHNFNYKIFNTMIGRSLQFCFLVLLSFSSVAFSNEASNAIAQIQKMSDAMHKNSYSGDFVYVHGSMLESMSIQHVQTKKGLRERLFSLNGEAREVFRDDESLTCVWPGSKKIVQDKTRKSSFSPLWIPDDVTRLAKFYNFKMVGMGRIANRLGNVVLIKPKDGMRYGMKIWIDEKEGYLLKSVLFNQQGVALEQVMFTQINTIESPDLIAIDLKPRFIAGYNLISSHTAAEDNRMMPDSAWKLDKLPIGFWQESAYKKPIKNGDGYIHHMVFTDGLASLSLFIEKQTNDSLMGSSSMGAVNAYGIIINGYSVTAVGEVPHKTVKQLVSSISYE